MNIQIHTRTYVYLLIDAMFPVPKKAVIIKNTWRKSGVKNDTENIAHIVASGKKIYFGVEGGGPKKFSFLAQGYKKVRSPDVVQLQLSDHGDVDVCGEIKSEELKTHTRTRKEWGFPLFGPQSETSKI